MFRFLAIFWLRAAFCLAAAALARFWRSVAIRTDGVRVEAASNRTRLAEEAAFLVPQAALKSLRRNALDPHDAGDAFERAFSAPVLLERCVRTSPAALAPVRH